MVELMVTIALIALLAAVLFPVVTSARRQALQATCHQNMMKIGQAIIAYHQDNNIYPTPENPIGALATSYTKTLPKVPTCPFDRLA
jgi:type II secretory pathway pseudopilin PulG